MRSPDADLAIRPMTSGDFALMHAWLAQPHARRWYRREAMSLDQVATRYGQFVERSAPTFAHIAEFEGRPFGYLQAYRQADWPHWAEVMERRDGVGIDLLIGEPDLIGRGLGRRMLRHYVAGEVRSLFPDETICRIAHKRGNGRAIACSRAAGFLPDGEFREEGAPMVRLWRPIVTDDPDWR